MKLSKNQLIIIGLGLIAVFGLLLVVSRTFAANAAGAAATHTPVATNPDLDHGGRGQDPNVTGWSTVDMGCGTWQYSPQPFGQKKVAFVQIVVNPQATPAVPQVSCAQKTFIDNVNENTEQIAYEYVCVYCVIPATNTFAGDHNPAHFQLVIQGQVMHIKVTWDRTPCMTTGQETACMNPSGTPIGKEYPLPATQTPSPTASLTPPTS